jgi:hypothetical protein
MPSSPGSSILRAVRLVYGAILLLAATCGLGAYYFWPGFIAWLFLALGAMALVGGVALTQLLARFRTILWLLPYLERLRTMRIARLGQPGDKSGRDSTGR